MSSVNPLLRHIRTPSATLGGLAALLLPCGLECIADLADLQELGRRGLSGRVHFAPSRGGRRGGVVIKLDGGMGAPLLGRLIVGATDLETLRYLDGDPLNLTRENLTTVPSFRRVVVDAERARMRAGVGNRPIPDSPPRTVNNLAH